MAGILLVGIVAGVAAITARTEPGRPVSAKEGGRVYGFGCNYGPSNDTVVVCTSVSCPGGGTVDCKEGYTTAQGTGNLNLQSQGDYVARFKCGTHSVYCGRYENKQFVFSCI